MHLEQACSKTEANKPGYVGMFVSYGVIGGKHLLMMSLLNFLKHSGVFMGINLL